MRRSGVALLVQQFDRSDRHASVIVVGQHFEQEILRNRDVVKGRTAGFYIMMKPELHAILAGPECMVAAGV